MHHLHAQASGRNFAVAGTEQEVAGWHCRGGYKVVRGGV